MRRQKNYAGEKSGAGGRGTKIHVAEEIGEKGQCPFLSAAGSFTKINKRASLPAQWGKDK